MTALIRLIRLILTALAALAACLAPPAAGRPALRPAAAAAVRPALWKLSDADTTIYLFGTIHALPKGVNWFNGEVARAFNGSDELVTEILQTGGAGAGPATLAKALLPQGQTLRSLMSQPQRDGFEKALADLGLKNDSLDRFKPWYAAVYLSTLPLLKAGYNPGEGVDAALDARAAAAKRRHAALETMDFQLGLFDGLPMEVQVSYLNEIVEHMPTLGRELTDMVDQWRAGNAAKLAELMNADEDDPVIVDRLILARNRTWAQWIKARMERPGTVFLAVGAGHLAGKGSVQEQLAVLGFNTTRVQ